MSSDKNSISSNKNLMMCNRITDSKKKSMESEVLNKKSRVFNEI